mmetsp:Transcript_25289/g.23007  ORF Transcript_25289/g.23007 Transcript_25289/m.23007 type:complete len:132 (-) Transcript_25289:393-788(-)
MKHIIINELSYDINPFNNEFFQSNNKNMYEGILWDVPVFITINGIKRALQLHYSYDIKSVISEKYINSYIGILWDAPQSLTIDAINNSYNLNTELRILCMFIPLMILIHFKFNSMILYHTIMFSVREMLIY